MKIVEIIPEMALHQIFLLLKKHVGDRR